MRFRYGIEHELAILRGGVFADFTDLTFDELQSVLDVLPLDAADYPDLRVGDQGIKRKRWYVEGYERFDDHGELVRCDPKGLEVRTRIHGSVEAAVDALAADIDLLNAQLRATRTGVVRHRVQPAALGLRDRPPAGGVGARAPHRLTRGAHRASAHGQHLRPGPQPLGREPRRAGLDRCRPQAHPLQALDRAAVVLLPVPRRKPWGGLSATTHRHGGAPGRAGVPGPDAPQIASDPSLTQPARLPAEIGRLEFKAFDAIGDLALYGELLSLLTGLVLDDTLPGRPTTPDAAAHRHVAAWARRRAVHAETGALLTAADRAWPSGGTGRLAALRARWTRRECGAATMLAAHAAGATVADVMLVPLRRLAQTARGYSTLRAVYGRDPTMCGGVRCRSAPRPDRCLRGPRRRRRAPPQQDLAEVGVLLDEAGACGRGSCPRCPTTPTPARRCPVPRRCRSSGSRARAVTRLATSAGTISRTTAKAPAACMASASSMSRSPASPRPWMRNPPSACSDCGVKPRCAITGMPAAGHGLDVRREPRPDLQLHRVRPAFLHEPDGGRGGPARGSPGSLPNGRSATTSARGPRPVRRP